MRCLPVIGRELRVAARRPATYKQRFVAGGLSSAVVAVFAMFTPALSASSGHRLFTVVSIGGFIICILEGLRETADSLSQERREGTLGLLFLTDLRGFDVVIGKLAAAAIKAFTILLAMLPAFALPIWLGGVTVGEFWRSMAALATCLLFSMGAGVFVSALTEGAFAALVGSVVLVGLMIGIPALNIWFRGPLPSWTAGPLGMFLFAPDSSFSLSPDVFWKALFLSSGVTCLLFSLAARFSRNVSGATSRLSSSGLIQKLLQPGKGYTATWAGGSSYSNPAIWLAERTLPGRKALWLVIITLSAIALLLGCSFGGKGIAVIIGIQLFFGFFLKLWIAAVSVQPFNFARRSGALELLLCTPLTPQKLIDAHVDAVRGYFFLPAVVGTFAPILLAAIAAAFVEPKSAHEEMLITICAGILWFVIFLLDLSALTYCALWFGLTESQVPQAVGKTVFRVLILPLLTLVVPCLGLLGIIVWPWIWIVWASSKLRQRLHFEAQNQYAQEQQLGS